jgi:hypothetical protein
MAYDLKQLEVLITMHEARKLGCPWSVIAKVLNRNYQFTKQNKKWSAQNANIFYRKVDQITWNRIFREPPIPNKNSSAYKMVEAEGRKHHANNK